MKLYGERLPAPNPRRVRIFLAEKGISIPYEDVPLRRAAHKTPEFKQKNSLGQVPVLELDDGSFLSESVSICRYLEELHPEPVLFGRNALERAHVDMWIRRVELVLMNPISHYWVHAHPLTAMLLEQFKEFGESNKERTLKAMRWFARELDGHAFVVGDAYTMADIVALTSIDFAKFIGIEVPDDYVQLKAWHARVSERPSASA